MKNLGQLVVEELLSELDMLDEGVYDPGIFKAVFMAGGPAAGKTSVSSEIFGIPKHFQFSADGLRSVNADYAFEIFLKKAGYGTKLANLDPETFQRVTSKDKGSVRSRAQAVSAEMFENYLHGRLGVLIDTTGGNYEKVRYRVDKLRSLGYDCMMVFVNTSLETALARNRARDRVLPDSIVISEWKEVQENLGRLQGLFANNFIIVDNNDLDGLHISHRVLSDINKFVRAPIQNIIGKRWVERELEMRKRRMSYETKKSEVEPLTEGVYDPGIFKAVFMAGGPGSGKTTVSSDIFGIPHPFHFSVHGLRSVNSDTAFEDLLKKAGISSKLNTLSDDEYAKIIDTTKNPSCIKAKARTTMQNMFQLYTHGRLGVLIDSTGKDYARVKSQVDKLRSLGYDCLMVFVNTSLEAALQRNKLRSRVLPDSEVIDQWKGAQENIGRYQGLFQNNFIVVDNNNTNGLHIPKNVYAYIEKFMRTPVQNIIGKKWIERELELRKQRKTYESRCEDGTMVEGRKVGDQTTQTTASTSSEGPIVEGKNGQMTLVGVYGGRFQPFGRHHFAAYQELQHVTGPNTFIATSDKTDDEKSPFSFRDKKRIIQKYGVSPSHIVQVKNNYAPEEILRKFDPKTTALVVMFGEKDAGRLNNGKYFRPYKPNEPLLGYKDAGYFIVGKHQSVMVGGRELSGTQIRNFLGSHKIDDEKKKKLFKAIFGWYDPELFDLITKKAASVTPANEAKEPLKFNMFGKGTPEQQLRLSKLYNKALRAFPNSPRQKEIDKEIQALRKEMGLKYIKSESLVGEMRTADTTNRLLLQEGGAYGHMSHPFDDNELTFGDLKSIIILALQGHLDRETKVSEKLDGQALSVSWVNGRLVAARNKSHLKNGGANALDVDGVKKMFSGRGALEDSFGGAMDDLQTAISKLTDKQKEKVFQNGKNFMALEVIYPKTTNVLPYGQSSLVFHGVITYDNNGNPIGGDTEYARMLAGMIRQINADRQKTFQIKQPSFLTIPPSQDFSSKSKMFVDKVDRLKNQLGLKDSDTLALYHQRWWELFVDRQAKKYKYALPNTVRTQLVKRWAFGDTSNRINDIVSLIRNESFASWVKEFDKEDHDAQVKKNMLPFELIFLRLGAEVLSNASGFLAANPDKAVAQVRKRLDSTIKQLQGSTDIRTLDKLKTELDRIQQIGGFEKIVPVEGLVFNYNGKTFKLTGSFAPVNQLLGITKYGGR